MIRNGIHYIWHRSLRDTGIRRLQNNLRYGADAPRPHERIWVNPGLIRHRHKRPHKSDLPLGSRYSGCIMDGDWDQNRRRIWASQKYKACRLHFTKGVSWEDTGIIDFSMRRIARDGQLDGMRTQAEILDRYAAIDTMMAQIMAERTLRPSTPDKPTEIGGVLVHIARDGSILFGNEGYHRLALSRIAQLDVIPARLGITHRAVLETDRLSQLRQPPAS